MNGIAPRYLVRGVVTALLLAPLFTHLAHAQPGKRLKEAFGRLDSDDDGKLSPSELGRSLRAKQRLDGADTDGDGAITFDEFHRRVASLVRSSRSPVPKAENAVASAAPAEDAEE